MEQPQITTVSLPEASRIMGLSTATIRKMCLDGRLKHSRLVNGNSGRTTFLIHRDAINELLKPYVPQPLPERPKRQIGRPQKVML